MKKTVSFDNVRATVDTGKALLCHLPDVGEVWIPHSQIDEDSEVYDAQDNAEGQLVITEWLALQKRLV